jgi:deferrochelatase/peroxidase EfeB
MSAVRKGIKLPPVNSLVVGLLILVGSSAQLFGQRLADAAEKDLHLAKATHYQHKTHIDKTTGVFDVDCSGFVDHLLKQVAPQQYDQLPIEPGHTRPRAEVYYQFFVELAQTPKAGWKAVSRFAELRRGDLIAWKKETAAQETGDTGHVMVVGAAPVRLGTTSYQLTVYDSTKSPHDNDTRGPGADGIGRGDLFFYVNAQDIPIAFQFSSQRQMHDAPISMGRLSP